jgi:glycolate oxidase FAD binding subunit
MANATASRPANETTSPPTQSAVADAVRAAYEASRAVYPLGGGTALDYGNAPTHDGTRLDLTGLDRIVDYTPRDMTIVVEAGMRIAALAKILAAEGQHLPIDVPRSAEATLGGVVATNWTGPRRYGHGTIRDYVIGIHAVDGRGVTFKAGGRVVKNVAGYDFCKLLSGSLGTLGVITQLALKVKPKPEASAAVVAAGSDLTIAEKMLGRLIQLPAPPIAVDLLIGEAWQLESPICSPQSEIRNCNGLLVIRLEGTELEVAALAEQAQYELWSGGAADVRRLDAKEADSLWSCQVEFSDRPTWTSLSETQDRVSEKRGHVADDGAPLVVKIAVPPGAVTQTVAELVSFDPGCTIQAHAGNGIVLARFSQFSHADLTHVLVARLRPAAVSLGGSLVIVSSKLEGLTPHLIWGGRTDAIVLMERIKQKIDPRSILNPGRFVF